MSANFFPRAADGRLDGLYALEDQGDGELIWGDGTGQLKTRFLRGSCLLF